MIAIHVFVLKLDVFEATYIVNYMPIINQNLKRFLTLTPAYEIGTHKIVRVRKDVIKEAKLFIT